MGHSTYLENVETACDRRTLDYQAGSQYNERLRLSNEFLLYLGMWHCHIEPCSVSL